MRKMFVVAAREYKATVRTKAFLISLVLMPTIMGAGVLIQMLLKDRIEAKERTYLVVDRTPGATLFPRLAAAAQRRNESETHDAAGKQTKPLYQVEYVPPSADTPEALRQQRYELSERIRRRECHGLLEIGAEVHQPLAADGSGMQGDPVVLRYQSNSPLSREFSRWAEKVLNDAIHEERCGAANLSFAQVQSLLQPVPLLARGLARKHPTSGVIEDGREDNLMLAFLLPYGLLFFMFMMVFMGALPLMQGVIEEKINRIAEVLLGSVPPFQLMLGKLLGTVGVSLTLSAVYLSGAFTAAVHYGYTDHISLEVMAWFVVFQVLGVLMFGSLFLAVGAACTSMQETQALLMPVTLLAAFPMFFIERVIREPDSVLVTCLSFFPPATPSLMVTRLAIPPGLPWWQPVLGGIALLATALLCVWAAGRIFRVGLLVQGKGASLRQLVQWLVRA